MAERQQAVAKVILADPDVSSFWFVYRRQCKRGPQHRAHVHSIEAVRSEKRDGGGDHPALASETRGDSRNFNLPAIDPEHSSRRPSRPHAISIHASGHRFKNFNEWAPKLLAKLQSIPGLQDVASDQQTGSPQLMIKVNRDAASRLGVNITTIEQNTLRRFRPALHRPALRAAEHVPHHPRGRAAIPAGCVSLSRLYVHGAAAEMIPISQFAKLEPTPAAVSVNHQGQFPSVTLSFNLRPGVSLGQAVGK